MKICPNCRTLFADDLNYCLHDGTTLQDEKFFDPEATISATVTPTLEYQSAPTGQQHEGGYPPGLNRPSESLRRPNRLPVVAGIFGLMILAAIVGSGLYFLNSIREGGINRFPTPPPEQSSSPRRTPTPVPSSNLKIEILEQVQNNRGEKFLKCRLTNTGITVARPYTVTATLYNEDVRLREATAFVKLEYLKPGQSVPVWIALYKNDKYTSLKLKEPAAPFAVPKPEDRLFPELIYRETEMKLQYTTSYKVQGIVENQNYETISPDLYVLFLDDKSEIIGIGKTYVSDLKRGDKAIFEATINENDLFGKPKSFEIIAVDD